MKIIKKLISVTALLLALLTLSSCSGTVVSVRPASSASLSSHQNTSPSNGSATLSAGENSPSLSSGQPSVSPSEPSSPTTGEPTVSVSEPVTPDTPTPVTPDTPTPDTPTPVTPDTPTPDTPTPVTPDTPTPATPTPVTPDTPTPETPTIVVPPFDPLAFEDYQYEFKSDLSAYEPYMNVRGEDYLILVNADHPLPQNYVPSDLVAAENTRGDRSKLEKDGSIAVGLRLYAEKAMEALYIEAEANGMLYVNEVKKSDGSIGKNRLGITTAYRSYAVQKYLFNSYVERDMKLPENAGKTRAQVEEIVATYSCRPGTSEHQTGLCADMHNWPTAGRAMADDFAASPAGKWLIENCYKFGYVLRFDKDKTSATGITYESWHFRFVGRFHATRMHELHMCLEEYIAYLENNGCTINVKL